MVLPFSHFHSSRTHVLSKQLCTAPSSPRQSVGTLCRPCVLAPPTRVAAGSPATRASVSRGQACSRAARMASGRAHRQTAKVLCYCSMVITVNKVLQRVITSIYYQLSGMKAGLYRKQIVITSRLA